MDILARLERARALAREKHLEGDRLKLGNLRAGNSGIMDPQGNIAGGCHRRSHLRQLGIELEVPTTDKLLMFDLGFANEDLVYDALVTTLSEGETMLREEEIPIEWMTTNGTKVTGRPDIVILNQGKPTRLLELKSVHSMWTAKDVFFNKTPKMENLVQTAHYMWKLDVQGSLIYRSYSQLGQGMAGGKREDRKWMLDQFPKFGQPGSEFIEFNKKTGVPKHLKQFEIVYDVEFDIEGVLQYRVEGTDRWVTTVISKQDIERYFEYVSTMGEKKLMGPTFTLIKADGRNDTYNHADYCDACKLADFAKGDYDRWLELARTVPVKPNTSK